MKANVSNVDVALQVGVTHSMISRLRSGNRHPSIPTMRVIEREFNWPLLDQVAASQATEDEQRYGVQFEKKLIDRFGPERGPRDN